ncbi:hypothetical protein B0H13DRAFT_1876055 [Mycena leptocephala]|nr:hypothetical protein B0H13DRAFT_1876055 [Mycena leptocephala]
MAVEFCTGTTNYLATSVSRDQGHYYMCPFLLNTLLTCRPRPIQPTGLSRFLSFLIVDDEQLYGTKKPVLVVLALATIQVVFFVRFSYSRFVKHFGQIQSISVKFRESSHVRNVDGRSSAWIASLSISLLTGDGWRCSVSSLRPPPPSAGTPSSPLSKAKLLSAAATFDFDATGSVNDLRARLKAHMAANKAAIMANPGHAPFLLAGNARNVLRAPGARTRLLGMALAVAPGPDLCRRVALNPGEPLRTPYPPFPFVFVLDSRRMNPFLSGIESPSNSHRVSSPVRD